MKDRFLNDCLSDALIYQGQGSRAVREAMVDALGDVFRSVRAEAGTAPPGPLVIVTESLGSKITFDALQTMLDGRDRDLAQYVRDRLRVVFMAANQVPLLQLADPAPEAQTASMLRFLSLPRKDRSAAAGDDRIDIVAFTDPNDLLSYRLAPAVPVGAPVRVTDILVSNDFTWLGLFENPLAAHGGYLMRPEVARAIAYGPKPRR